MYKLAIVILLSALTYASYAASKVCFSNETTQTTANPTGTPVTVIWYGWDGDRVVTIKNGKDPKSTDNELNTYCFPSSGCIVFKMTIDDGSKGGNLGTANCGLAPQNTVGSYQVNARTDGSVGRVFITGPDSARAPTPASTPSAAEY